ncbi:hypothetical protein LguiA_022847 [Lonicera macranthoides]
MSCLESTSMSELPAHILFDIFSRLPPNTIGHCRCVYKTWFNLLLDPHFVNLHLSKSPSCLMINEYKGQQSTTLKLFEIDDEPDHHRVHREPAITLQHGVGEKLSYKVQSMGYFASGNSMITTILTYSIQFCESMYSFRSTNMSESLKRTCLTDSDSAPLIASQYKVFRIFQGNVPCNPPSGSGAYVSECEVYTVGTNTWRSVGHVPFSICIHVVYVNGGFHWLSTDIPEMIAHLDLETESFQTVCSTPPPLDSDALYLITL